METSQALSHEYGKLAKPYAGKLFTNVPAVAPFLPAFSPPFPVCAARSAVFSVFIVPYFLFIRRRKDTSFFDMQEDLY
jgi:hypothetical protein